MVVDATLGQNAVVQGKSFHEAVGLTGIVLTKMDGLSRGGTIFQIFDELQVPIRFLGVGERENDLESFDFRSFIEDLFDQGASTS
jgi:fused signal recognition particle receptor